MRAFVCFAILVFVQVAEAQTDSGKRLRPETRYCWVLEKPGRNQDEKAAQCKQGETMPFDELPDDHTIAVACNLRYSVVFMGPVNSHVLCVKK